MMSPSDSKMRDGRNFNLEKGEHYQQLQDDDIDSDAGMPPRNQYRSWASGFLIVGLIYLLISPLSKRAVLFRPCGNHGARLSSSSSQQISTHDDRRLVPLEAHIMSKCPDAQVSSSIQLLINRRGAYTGLGPHMSYLDFTLHTSSVQITNHLHRTVSRCSSSLPCNA